MTSVVNANLYTYALPLWKPMTTGVPGLQRNGLLLELAFADGTRGVGEIAPLEGLHKETLQDAEHALRDVMQRGLRTASEWLAAAENCPLPSVAFGIEQAVVNAVAIVTPTPGMTIPVSTLICEQGNDLIKAAISATAQGFQTLKIKVGRASVKDELAMLRSVREAVGKKTQLRLDANRAWDLGDAVAFAKGLSRIKAAYIEEPLKNPASLAEFFALTEQPIALDETWVEHPALAADLLTESVAALVIKPSLLGTHARIESALQKANQPRALRVLSPAYESGLGLSRLLQLSQQLGDASSVPGVGTYAWLKQDLLTPPFRPFRGSVEVAALLRVAINFSPRESAQCALLFSC